MNVKNMNYFDECNHVIYTTQYTLTIPIMKNLPKSIFKAKYSPLPLMIVKLLKFAHVSYSENECILLRNTTAVMKLLNSVIPIGCKHNICKFDQTSFIYKQHF